MRLQLLPSLISEDQAHQKSQPSCQPVFLFGALQHDRDKRFMEKRRKEGGGERRGLCWHNSPFFAQRINRWWCWHKLSPLPGWMGGHTASPVTKFWTMECGRSNDFCSWAGSKTYQSVLLLASPADNLKETLGDSGVLQGWRKIPWTTPSVHPIDFAPKGKRSFIVLTHWNWGRQGLLVTPSCSLSYLLQTRKDGVIQMSLRAQSALGSEASG